MKRSQSQRKLAVIVGIIILVFLSVHMFHKYCLQSSILRYKMLNDYLVDSDEVAGQKFILFWTKFFDVPMWGMKRETYHAHDLKSMNCPETNCVFTHQKNLLKHPHDYDAIVFHAAESWNFLNLPRTRRSQQVYIMASKESPGEVKHNLKLDHDFYNLTMTYRLDSDIQWFYGTTIDILSGAVVAPAINVQWREVDDNFNDNEIYSLVVRKQKTATWFVSHCEVASHREDLTRKLQQFINVDVYGKCGTLSCPRHSSECDLMLNTTYN